MIGGPEIRRTCIRPAKLAAGTGGEVDWESCLEEVNDRRSFPASRSIAKLRRQQHLLVYVTGIELSLAYVLAAQEIPPAVLRQHGQLPAILR